MVPNGRKYLHLLRRRVIITNRAREHPLTIFETPQCNEFRFADPLIVLPVTFPEEMGLWRSGLSPAVPVSVEPFCSR
jgi:hypothetical protein